MVREHSVYECEWCVTVSDKSYEIFGENALRNS